MSILVPKVFHRIWLGGKPMPEPFRSWGRSWTDLHPGWTMVEWTERNLPELELMGPWVRQALADCSNLSQKSDVLRYCLLGEYGGVYLDTDFECKRNIEPLIDGSKMFAAWQYDDQGEPGAVASGFFGCVPEHPLLKEIYDDLPKQDFKRFRSISPPYFTSFARPWVAGGEMRVLPRALFYPYSYTELDRHREYFSEAYAVHHWAGKWCASSFAGAGGAEEVRRPEDVAWDVAIETSLEAACVVMTEADGFDWTADNEEEIKVRLNRLGERLRAQKRTVSP